MWKAKPRKGVFLAELDELRALPIVKKKKADRPICERPPYEEIIERYLKVTGPDGLPQPWKLWTPQKRYLQMRQRAFDEGRTPKIVVLKPGQIGMSTIIGAANAIDLMRFDGARLAIAANKMDVARHVAYHYVYEICCQLRTVLKDPPKISSPRTDTDITFRVGRSEVRIVSAFTGRAAGRSMASQLLHVSELAFWPEGVARSPDDVMKAILARVPDAHVCHYANATIESTAWGPSGLFYEMWRLAEQGANGLEALFSPWYECEKYSIPEAKEIPPEAEWPRLIAEALRVPVTNQAVTNWYHYVYRLLHEHPGEITPGNFWWLLHDGMLKANGDLGKFNQEFPASPGDAFLATSSAFFSPKVIAAAHRTSEEKSFVEMEYVSSQEPPYIRRHSGIPGKFMYMRVWEPPREGVSYYVGVDCALGQGIVRLDNQHDVSASVISVWSQTGEQVAEFWSPEIHAEELVEYIVALAKHYNDALVNIERNHIGSSLAHAMEEREDVRQHYTYLTDRKGTAASAVPGSLVSPRTRMEYLTRFRAMLESGRAVVRSPGLAEEIAEFIVKNGLPVGRLRDDRVWAAAHAWTALVTEQSWMRDGHDAWDASALPDVLPADDDPDSWVRRVLGTRFGRA